jgi:Xaa-Pro aminopeptidase
MASARPDSPPGRLAAVREWLRGHDEFDGLLLVRQENLEDFDLRYLTGFTGSSGYALVTPDQAVFLTDVRYREQAARQCPGWRIEQHGRPATKELAAALQGAGVRRLAFEPAGITVELCEHLRAGLPEVTLHAAAGTVTTLRERKDAAEVAAIARACAISDAAFADLLPLIRPGVSERELARRLEDLFHQHGADGTAFETIAASGPNSALPHARPSAREIAAGDLITFDFGAAVAGYCADITRTVVVGPASPRQKHLYEAVRQIQSDGVAAMRAGARCSDIDAAAKQAIAAAGYGEYPTHSLGHGVGLAIHEAPAMRPGSDDILAPGHVVTVEPGIYIPGFGGVRIEDTVVIEEQGCRVLTATPRTLIELPAG